MLKLNKRPIGKKSPNLVTLPGSPVAGKVGSLRLPQPDKQAEKQKVENAEERLKRYKYRRIEFGNIDRCDGLGAYLQDEEYRSRNKSV
jgi:hypothetical protein